jgi:hypothetical protein
MEKRLESYLSFRRSALATEVEWLRSRIRQGVDVHRGDRAILDGLSAELAWVDGLLNFAETGSRVH